MDTSTLIILLVILVVIIVVVFFGVRGLLISAFIRPPRTPNKLLPAPDQINYGQNQPMQVKTLSNSDEFIVVDLPRKFTGQGENIDINAICWLKGKAIRECIRSCNCEEFAELRQKQHGGAQQW